VCAAHGEETGDQSHSPAQYIITGLLANAPACAGGGVTSTAIHILSMVHWVGVEPMPLRDETSGCTRKPVVSKWNNRLGLVVGSLQFCRSLIRYINLSDVTVGVAPSEVWERQGLGDRFVPCVCGSYIS
jgi:hypothetical protein